MKWIHAFVIAVCLHPVAVASHWERTEPESVTFSYNKQGVEIALARDDSGKLSSLKINWDGKLLEVPAGELAGIADARISRTRALVSVSLSAGIPLRPSENDLGFIEIRIPYGKATVNVHSDQCEQVSVSYDEVAFHFQNGKLVTRTRAISAGDGKKSWKMFSKEPGDPEIEDGEHKGPQNPYGED